MADVAIQPNNGAKLFGYNTGLVDSIRTISPSYHRDLIDRFAANGATVIRFMGMPYLVRESVITQSAYESYVRSIVEYAARHGIYSYPCEWTAVPGHEASVISSGADFAAIISGVIVNALDDYKQWIVGYDFIQEANISPFSAADCLSIYTAIKSNVAAAGKTMPYGLTCSITAPTSSTTALAARINACDYIDYHAYTDNGSWTAAEINSILSTYSSKQFIMGECGVCQDPGNVRGDLTWINTCFTASFSTAVANQARMRGGLYWTINQYDTATDNDWGAYAVANLIPRDGLTPRSTKLQRLYSSTSSSAGPEAPLSARTNHVNGADGGISWNPRQSTTYAHSRIYRNGALLADNLVDGYYNDSAYWRTRQARYQGSVVTSGAVESARTPAIILPGRLPPKLLRRRARPTFR